MLAGGSTSGNASRPNTRSRAMNHIMIVPPDALVRLAAFVEAVRREHAFVQVPDRHLADVLGHELREVRELHLGQHAAAAFDLAGGREPVPERLTETVSNQQPLLLDVRHPWSDQQRRVGLEQTHRLARAVARSTRRSLACARRARGGRYLPAASKAAVQTAPVDHVRTRERVFGKELRFAVDELPGIRGKERILRDNWPIRCQRRSKPVDAGRGRRGSRAFLVALVLDESRSRRVCPPTSAALRDARVKTPSAARRIRTNR